MSIEAYFIDKVIDLYQNTRNDVSDEYDHGKLRDILAQENTPFLRAPQSIIKNLKKNHTILNLTTHALQTIAVLSIASVYLCLAHSIYAISFSFAPEKIHSYALGASSVVYALACIGYSTLITYKHECEDKLVLSQHPEKISVFYGRVLSSAKRITDVKNSVKQWL